MQKYQKPCVLISICDDGSAVGSGRSMGGFSLHEAFSYCSDIFDRYGGHEQAAGCRLKSEDVDKFRDKINEYYDSSREDISPPVRDIDLQVDFAEIDSGSVIDMRRLEPHGMGNPQPVFLLRDCEIAEIYSVSGGKYTRFSLKQNLKSFYAISFAFAFDSIPFKKGDIIDVVVTFDINEEYSKDKVNVKILDIRPSSFDEAEYIKNNKNFARAISGNIGKLSSGFGSPTREDVGKVYKYIVKEKSVVYDLDMLYFALSSQGIDFYTLSVSVAVLLELSLLYIENKDEKLYLSVARTDKKVSLDSSELMTNLKKVAISI